MHKGKSLIPPIDETDKHNCYAFYMAGADPVNVSEMTGVNVNTIKSWVSQLGWFREREAMRAAHRKLNPPEASPVMKAFSPDKAAENIRIFEEKTGKIAKEDAEHWADKMDADERLAQAPNIAALSKTHRANLKLDREEPGERGLINITFLTNPDAVKVIQSPAVVELEDAKQSA